MDSRTETLTCPHCGQHAKAEVTRHAAGGRTEVHSFECPGRCDVDDEAVRQIIGTSGN